MKTVSGFIRQNWSCAVALMLAASSWAADSDVVLNEIMYHPPGDREDLQYVELFNRGDTRVDLSGWRFTKGLKFILPEQTMLEAGACLVICRNLESFHQHYGKDIRALGEFSGRLSRGGERIELSDARKKVIDSVKYADRPPWPVGPDGLGPALERICPSAPTDDPRNWAASTVPPFERAAGTPGRPNDNLSANLPPSVTEVVFAPARPEEPITVSAIAADDDGVERVALLWRVVEPGSNAAEIETPMQRIAGSARQGSWSGVIPAQAAGKLVRFRLRARDTAGTIRWVPAANEPGPTFSCSTYVNTNDSRIPFAYAVHLRPAAQPVPGILRNTGVARAMTPNRGNDAFLFAPPGSNHVQVFDHVLLQSRNGGFKVHFPHGADFEGMSAINVIFEDLPRRVLSEHLSYALYQRAGVPAPRSEHYRVWEDGRPRGYRLMVEQPNNAFLKRHGRDDNGNLYKLIWEGHGVVGQHEKKTHVSTGHDDLIAMVEGLRKSSGAAQWEFIQREFNVEEFVNYYAVNMCIQNWDGFHNNYFAYHDTGGTGKWEIYPWDEDKTWGDYDGASPRFNWYTMPLTMGTADGAWQGGGGANWWRPGGWFGARLLTNPEFRRRFLARLEEICETEFTEARFRSVIDELEQRLDPEIAVRAEAMRISPSQARREFRSDMESFRLQLLNRRKFILAEMAKQRPAR